MEAIALPVEERGENRGSSSARRLRAEGKIPGVVYGKKSDTVNVVVADGELRRVLRHGQNVLLQLEYEEGVGPDKKQYAVIKELQRDPLRPRFLNVDLLEVYLDTEIESPVPIEVLGEPEGVKVGGILSQLVYEVLVRALPGKMPAKLQIDVTTLDMGQNVRVAELEESPDYLVITDPEEVIAAVVAPMAEKEVEEELEAEVAEELEEPTTESEEEQEEA
ncbi:MAG: 50S ribosomal protein L25 [Actinobacteria bacterium]|nr:50S ribosomal protein L25 [Actinomycetota bacterium]